MEDAPDFTAMGEPGAETRRNGAAILASAITREARLLASTAADLATALSIVPAEARGPDAEDRRIVRDGARDASALASALMVAARQIMRSPDNPAEAAQDAVGRMPRGRLTLGEVLSPIRTAALVPITDDGAARVSAAALADIFEREFTAAWHRAQAG